MPYLALLSNNSSFRSDIADIAGSKYVRHLARKVELPTLVDRPPDTDCSTLIWNTQLSVHSNYYVCRTIPKVLNVAQPKLCVAANLRDLHLVTTSTSHNSLPARQNADARVVL